MWRKELEGTLQTLPNPSRLLWRAFEMGGNHNEVLFGHKTHHDPWALALEHGAVIDSRLCCLMQLILQAGRQPYVEHIDTKMFGSSGINLDPRAPSSSQQGDHSTDKKDLNNQAWAARLTSWKRSRVCARHFTCHPRGKARARVVALAQARALLMHRGDKQKRAALHDYRWNEHSRSPDAQEAVRER